MQSKERTILFDCQYKSRNHYQLSMQLIQVFRFFGFILLLLLEFSPQDIFQIYLSAGSSFSLSRPLALSTLQSPAWSSRPRSKDFLAFVGPWLPARSEFPTERFILQEVKKQKKRKNTKQKHKNPQGQKNQTKNNTTRGFKCMNTIKLSIILLTSI